MKKFLSLTLAFLLMLSTTLTGYGAEYPAFSGGIEEIEKYGNISVSGITGEELLAAGYEYGDVVSVTVNGVTNAMPFCTNYSDVDVGQMVLRDNEGLTIAINMGDYASAYNLASKTTNEDKTVSWTFPEGQSLESSSVTIEMAEKGAYTTQMMIHQLERTNNREDYDSDAVFANFRNISSGDLGENALFRSSSPINPELGRAAYADDFAEANGVQTVLNLTDYPERVESFFAEEGFDSPYYKSLYENGHVIALNLSVDFKAEDFKKGLGEGLKFLASNSGPYLIHCTEGKDRAGFTSALLACLMGATYDEVVEDYMTTYENYYHLVKGSEKYEAVKSSNIDNMLRHITGSENVAELTSEQLAAGAAEYIRSSGLSDEELVALKNNLAADYSLPVQPAADETPEIISGPSTYTVVSGDTLWDIALRVYGTGNRWNEIYEANAAKIKNPERIHVGQTLVLPAA